MKQRLKWCLQISKTRESLNVSPAARYELVLSITACVKPLSWSASTGRVRTHSRNVAGPSDRNSRALVGCRLTWEQRDRNEEIEPVYNER
eukprot:3508675-Prymnesium_polylepis.2